MKVLVIGAGVGGLALARGLVADGHRVRVFEKAPGLRSSGGALTLWSNGAGIVAELGGALEGAGAPIDVLAQYEAGGRPLLRMDMVPAVRRYGWQHVCVPRRRLVRLLADGLPEGSVSFGRECTGVVQDGDGVRVDFADGSGAAGDVLVGADGHHSVVRRALRGREACKPSGWATWQGMERVPLDLVAGREGRLIIGREGMCGLLPAGEGLLQWWFDRPWRPGEPPPESPLAELRRWFGHWKSPVPEVLASIGGEEIEVFPHCRHPVPRTWGEGRCTLVGDAAHTMPPAQAQGANQALEDAWALTLALRGASDVPAALRRYERRRAGHAAFASLAARTEYVNRYLPSLHRLVPDRLTGPAYTWWLRSVSGYLAALPR
ncbi:FAD-dependent oxidoreductase [Actinocorallia libanotica]|uniref:FAD-dependent urate hydroxylase HpxO n=1 Tax=Actinocorallia libanotica TaxID=46162 RepID=A0ABP4AKN5_9ACTN